jgi:hypothetical protein
MATRRSEQSAESPSTAPCSLRLHRADGLDLELTGDGRFVTATLERLLTVLGLAVPPS